MSSDVFSSVNAQGQSGYNAALNILTSVQATVSSTIYGPSPRYPERKHAESPPDLPARPAAPGPPDPDIIYNPARLFFDFNGKSYYVPLSVVKDLQPSLAKLARDLCNEVSPLILIHIQVES
jgi:hypothetical protein